MSVFTTSLKTPEGMVSLTFNRIYTVHGPIYFISATGRSIRHQFQMEERDGKWRLVQETKVPDRLYPYEDELAKAIIDHLQHKPQH